MVKAIKNETIEMESHMAHGFSHLMTTFAHYYVGIKLEYLSFDPLLEDKDKFSLKPPNKQFHLDVKKKKKKNQLHYP